MSEPHWYTVSTEKCVNDQLITHRMEITAYSAQDARDQVLILCPDVAVRCVLPAPCQYDRVTLRCVTHNSYHTTEQ